MVDVALPVIIKLRDPSLRARKKMGGPLMNFEAAKQTLVLLRSEEVPKARRRANM